MPKEISHIYFSEEIQKGLRAEIQTILEKHKNLYYYGSSSPDLFYYYLPLKKEYYELGSLDIGKYIHDDKENMNPIYKLLEWSKNSEENQKWRIFAFVAGYLTHVAADTIFHPYIYSITGHYYNPDIKLQKLAQRNHRIFETKMDLFILNHLYKTTLKEFKLLKKLSLSSKQKEVLKLYGKAIQESFFPSIEGKKMMEFSLFCYKNQMMLIKLFQNQPLVSILDMVKKFHFEIENHLCLCYGNHLDGYKINFEAFEPAPHPITGEIMEGNFFSFRDKIQDRGILFIESTYDFIVNKRFGLDFLKKQIPHYSLNTGLLQISHLEMKYFKPLATFSNPI